MVLRGWQVNCQMKIFDVTKIVLNVIGLRDEKIVEAHGTFSAAGCVSCGESYDIQTLQQHIMNDEDAKCRSCGGWVKPNIVFFGEQLPARFFDEAEMDCTFCDLLICIGTSLEVYPFAGRGHGNLDQVVLIQNDCHQPSGIVDAPRHVTPRLLINYDLVGSFGARPNDAALLGDIVQNINKVSQVLDWTEDLLEAQIENELNINK